MFALSQLFLEKFKIVKHNVQTFSIIIGLVLYASIYLYLLYTNNEYFTFYNNFGIYIILIDLLISGFIFYKNNKLHMSNSDLVEFLNYSENEDLNSENDTYLNSEYDENDDENDDDIDDKEENQSKSLQNVNNDLNIQNEDISHILSHISNFNTSDFDFNKLQQELLDSNLFHINNENINKFEEIKHEESNEELDEKMKNESNEVNLNDENTSENGKNNNKEIKEETIIETTELIEEHKDSEKKLLEEQPKKKRGRKPKSLSQTLTENKASNITLHISK